MKTLRKILAFPFSLCNWILTLILAGTNYLASIISGDKEILEHLKAIFKARNLVIKGALDGKNVEFINTLNVKYNGEDKFTFIRTKKF